MAKCILRLYEIVGEDCVGLNLQQLRPISLRDLVRWCSRVNIIIKAGGLLDVFIFFFSIYIEVGAVL